MLILVACVWTCMKLAPTTPPSVSRVVPSSGVRFVVRFAPGSTATSRCHNTKNHHNIITHNNYVKNSPLEMLKFCCNMFLQYQSIVPSNLTLNGLRMAKTSVLVRDLCIPSMLPILQGPQLWIRIRLCQQLFLDLTSDGVRDWSTGKLSKVAEKTSEIFCSKKASKMTGIEHISINS